MFFSPEIPIFIHSSEKGMCDKSCIDRILKGEKDEFRRLVEKYRDTVFRTAVGFVHNSEEAEDLTQEIFIRTYCSLEQFEGKSEFSTWLYRIAVNVCTTHVSRLRRRNFFRLTGDCLREALDIRSPEKNPLERMVENEKNRAIRRAIDGLPEKQHIAFTLSKYNEMPQKEIACVMQISEGAVEQLLQRAKINLQKKLNKP